MPHPLIPLSWPCSSDPRPTTLSSVQAPVLQLAQVHNPPVLLRAQIYNPPGPTTRLSEQPSVQLRAQVYNNPPSYYALKCTTTPRPTTRSSVQQPPLLLRAQVYNRPSSH